MKTVIMAGGRGSRLEQLQIQNKLPKPLMPVDGKSVLARIIEELHRNDFNDIILTVSYRKEAIMEEIGDGSRFGVRIRYFEEEIPLGNAGALFRLKDILTEDFLLLNADMVFYADLNRFREFHDDRQGDASLFVHPNSHPYDSGLICADKNNCVRKWLTKEDERPKYYSNCVNAGIHILSPNLLDRPINFEQKVDLDRDILRPLAGTGRMYCYNSFEYVKDMGTPERYNEVNEEVREGRAERKCRRHKQKAIFLDRDGTVNRYVGFLTDIEQFELEDRAAEAIRLLNQSDYLVIIVTNQPVVARGEVTLDELNRIHQKMETLLGNKGAYLDGIFFCPHHPNSGFFGEVKELKIRCSCRKPEPGMLFRAAEDYGIDLTDSWMIGDGEIDIEAGKAAGCRTVLLDHGTQGLDAGQDITAANLYNAVEEILNN